MRFSRYVVPQATFKLLSVVCSTKLDNTSLSFANRLALNSHFAFRLALIKLLSASGDGEIRTLDPLLARQVLSQLSYTPTDAGRPVVYGLSLFCLLFFFSLLFPDCWA